MGNQKSSQKVPAKDTDYAFRSAIFGAGSAGKSTLFNLLKREYEIQESHDHVEPPHLQHLLQRALERLLRYMITMKLPSPLGHEQVFDNLRDDERRTAAGRAQIADALEEYWRRVQPQWPGPPGAITNPYWTNAPYLMERVNPILRGSPDAYKGTDWDYVLEGSYTTDVYEIQMRIEIPGLKSFQLNMFDVGGRRCERKKWVHCYDSLALVIFVVDLSSYLRNLSEDTNRNSFTESLELFEDIANSRSLADVSLMVVFNQYDVFTCSLRLYPLPPGLFPNFNGDRSDPSEALEHIQQLFYDKLPKVDRPLRKVFFTVTTLVPTPCLSYGSVSPLCLSNPTPNNALSINLSQNVALEAATLLPPAIVQIICDYLLSTIIFSQELGRAILESGLEVMPHKRRWS